MEARAEHDHRQHGHDDAGYQHVQSAVAVGGSVAMAALCIDGNVSVTRPGGEQQTGIERRTGGRQTDTPLDGGFIVELGGRNLDGNK